MIPYTYLIGWSAHNKWYYGARWANGCDPSDLWFIYFTSSNYVKEFREQYGEPDIIEVRKTFKTQQEARDWEVKVLKRMKVKEEEKWLNKHDAHAPPTLVGEENGFFGKKHTQRYREKASISKQEYFSNTENRIKTSLSTKEGMKLYKEQFGEKEWEQRYKNIADKNSIAKKGKQEPWNKGKSGVYDEEVNKRRGESVRRTKLLKKMEREKL